MELLAKSGLKRNAITDMLTHHWDNMVLYYKQPGYIPIKNKEFSDGESYLFMSHINCLKGAKLLNYIVL